MLSERETLNTHIQKIIDEATDAWGIKVTNVEIKDIDLDESMIRVIAKQAEAERNQAVPKLFMPMASYKHPKHYSKQQKH